ncbi:MAG TPA: hypothetical protein VFQ53_39415 [Kofleriaceae bacterium]|nr:hypothetical protein [Kofleriaceae bacterium]
MTRPREVIPGRFYQITRRCSEQRFLLRPDSITNSTFEYCLAVAAKEHGITVVDHMVLSNHYHMVIFDSYGSYPAFLELFHVLVARAMNTRWGRRDHFWTAAQTSVVFLPDLETLIDKLVYTITNPIKHCLVEQVHQWPGAQGYSRLLSGERTVCKRPSFFFSNNSSALPATAELVLELPDGFKDRDAFLARLARAVDLRVEEHAAERVKAGERCLGRRFVRRQEWWHRPTAEQRYTRATRDDVSPTFACKDEERRKKLIEARADFLDDYAAARERWLTHKRCEFPVGTYWLARYARARVAVSMVGGPVTLDWFAE